MAYSYTAFGNITLPTYNRESDLSPVQAMTRFVQTAGGVFDADGSGRSLRRYPHSLTIDAIVSESTAVAQRTALDALRAAVGLRTYLYRVADNDGTIHRAVCRLAALTVMRSYSEHGYQPVTLQFQQLSAWEGSLHSYSWSLSSPSTKTVTVDGNLPVVDVIFTITAGAGALTNPILTGGGMDVRYTGTIAIGNALVIDCGTLSVLNDGVDGYSGFTLGANHVIEPWCELAPGETDLTLTVSGTTTGATWSVVFRDRWA